MNLHERLSQALVAQRSESDWARDVQRTLWECQGFAQRVRPSGQKFHCNPAVVLWHDSVCHYDWYSAAAVVSEPNWSRLVDP